MRLLRVPKLLLKSGNLSLLLIESRANFIHVEWIAGCWDWCRNRPHVLRGGRGRHRILLPENRTTGAAGGQDDQGATQPMAKALSHFDHSKSDDNRN
jgi:hypothetical protein